MAKRTPKSSRPVDAARTTTTTTTTMEPSAEDVAAPPPASEQPAAPVAAPPPASELPAALVSPAARADTGAESPQEAEKDPVQHVAEQLNRLLDVLGSTAGRVSPAPWAPAISVYETPVELLVTFDVPGTTRDALEVRTERGLLVISGQRNPSPLGDATIRHAESCFGPFRRVIPLPPGLRTADMKAHVESGVLHVRIPRDGNGGARRLAIA